MKQYNFLNRVVGWMVFLVAAVTYILTTEDSASFWDCGEFIATANNLLVGHPPGAPFFMIVGRLFAILAPSAELVAKMINIMSALASAFTILFLFWSITHLAKKIFIDNVEGGIDASWRVWSVMGAGAVGALAYTFSDTFWFSAVEGEVYAMSSLFTAIVFWAILKWENVADEPHSNRWIVFIAYMMGLSIGVHLLNLLCIPAIVMVYYYKKYDVTLKKTMFALFISCAIIIAILYGIIPGLVKIASYFELFFVNKLGMPYNSGAVIYMLLVIGVVVWGMWFTYKNGHRIWNLIVTSVAVIILGYTSFAMIVIRSAADPTMDQNSPEDVFSLMDYLNREQYGDRPLFYGRTFASILDYDNLDRETGKPIYIQRNDKYEVVEYRPEYKYQANMLFPRMYSDDERHIAQYKAWSGYTGRPVTVKDREGKMTTVMRPTMLENLRFFFSYQVNFMYWRYFLWNFSGRQNDIQSHGEIIHGNWITGIPFIDEMLVGDQELLPDSLRNNKGHNVYFMLPLLLGLAGVFYQFSKKRGIEGRRGFVIVFLLFFLTGLAIVMYLNQTPLQPRERDYAYAGSFYAFAIWIGLGVLAVIDMMTRYKVPAKMAAIASTIICLLAVPGLMAQQNWDDHDRSGCTIARDLAYNYLNSCDENAIIFTNGDNDTFPLWYAQEVEGIRTDVRVCNLSYLQTAWYCDQMKRKAYKSDPLPISFTHEQYTAKRDVAYIVDRTKENMPLKGVMQFVASDKPETKRLPNYSEELCYIPGRRYYLPVDKSTVMKNNVVSEEYKDQIVSQIDIKCNKNVMLKNEIMVLDMLCNSEWKRPMYYAVTVGGDNYFGLDPYFQLEGLAYRIAPIRSKAEGGQVGRVDTEKMYDKVMNKFKWGFYNKPGIYLDENKTRMATNLRNNLSRLSIALIEEAEELQYVSKHRQALIEEIAALKSGNAADNAKRRILTEELEYIDVEKAVADSLVAVDKFNKAEAVLDKIQYELPDSIIPHNYFSLFLAHGYYLLNQNEKGDEILLEFAKENLKEYNFYLSLDDTHLKASSHDMEQTIAIYYEIRKVANAFGRKEVMTYMEEMLTSFQDGIAKSEFANRP
jgi:hypothetical protein